MPGLNMDVPHGLSQEEATKRIQNLLNGVKSQFADQINDLDENWDDNIGEFSFSVAGMPVSGKLTVNPSDVNITGNLPFAAMFFKDKIESTIRNEADTLLA
jgi:hypothetical protein